MQNVFQISDLTALVNDSSNASLEAVLMKRTSSARNDQGLDAMKQAHFLFFVHVVMLTEKRLAFIAACFVSFPAAAAFASKTFDLTMSSSAPPCRNVHANGKYGHALRAGMIGNLSLFGTGSLMHHDT